MAAFSYKNVYDNFLNDGDFQHRCTVAGAVAAAQVFAEDPATAGHAARKVLATSVLNAPDTYAFRFAVVVTTDATNVAAGVKAIADVDLVRPILAQWNALAGA